jgi:SNF2 family DNA or RNA helicase
VFLISLKAGGTGLNLTAADTVIHYDPWWNPAVEAQASDRAHRIGQQSTVFVHKLICEGTIEERILALQKKKAALVAGLLESTGSLAGLSGEDIEFLLAPLT